MNILALDVATKCGWCTATASGTWTLTPKKDESKGMRLIRFKAKLKEMVDLEKIDLIIFEAAAVYGKFPNFVEMELHGVLKLFCEENHINYTAVAVTEIKKHATGKGNAGKVQMIEAAKAKLGYTGTDDNEADAMWIFNYALATYKVVK